jgi:diguanylate cyclase (GGDEF)-like protein
LRLLVTGAFPIMAVRLFLFNLQRRAAGRPPIEYRRRSFSLVPYLAVGAIDVLLVVTAVKTGGSVPAVAGAAVLLTTIVVARQVKSLFEHGRLLHRVDASRLELMGYQDQLTHRATHDALTDLANRTLFEQRTSESLAAAAPDGALSVALIDLDDFKAINDRLGHAVGDALLVVVAGRLRDCVRTNDVIARLGGDEFGLLLHGLRRGDAGEVLARITDALSRPVHALGHDLLVRASVGLAEAWLEASPQELLRRADLAMYAAKERGKGRHAVYDAELDQHQAADAETGAALRHALDNGEFSLVYQPIVALPSGAWTGLETLVRWHRPGHGVIGPDAFIPIAERTGVIVALGDWILRTALRQAVRWDQDFDSAGPYELGVNVSARQLREPGFAEDVAKILADTGFAPERLVVEVTETAVFDGGAALDTLQNLNALGVRIALDDFGTGYCSLQYLRRFPIDYLKIARPFIADLAEPDADPSLIRAISELGGSFGLTIIAEGIEHPRQRERLIDIGCELGQGFLFSRPQDPLLLEATLAGAR